MARKPTSGGKSNRASKEPTGVNNPASIPGVNAVATEPASSDIKLENKVTPEPRKFEVRKTEPRKNVVPINIEDEIGVAPTNSTSSANPVRVVRRKIG